MALQNRDDDGWAPLELPTTEDCPCCGEWSDEYIRKLHHRPVAPGVLPTGPDLTRFSRYCGTCGAYWTPGTSDIITHVPAGSIGAVYVGDHR